MGTGAARSRAAANSAAVGKRASGVLAIAFASTAVSAGGTSGRTARMLGTGAVTCWPISARAEVPLYGGAPASIS